MSWIGILAGTIVAVEAGLWVVMVISLTVDFIRWRILHR